MMLNKIHPRRSERLDWFYSPFMKEAVTHRAEGRSAEELKEMRLE